jgi:glycosyltransferase involved in cell wall biosynthesis
MNEASSVSIILPAKNESAGLSKALPSLRALYPQAQILVVDDGSTDDTTEVCKREGVEVISHRYSMGNGAAIKTGARTATGDVLVFMDADGQHRPDEVGSLLAAVQEGYEMAVGARSSSGQASIARRIANGFYNRFGSWMVDHDIIDLTSGFRAVNAKRFREFLYLLPNGFSYPTTISMAFFRSGYAIKYVPVTVERRLGKSHIRLIRDGIRFLLIIFRVATLYSPLKLFFPISFTFFSTGLAYYLYSYLSTGRFTNMSALLFINAVVIFLIGLVSEQITMLIFKNRVRSQDR